MGAFAEAREKAREEARKELDKEGRASSSRLGAFVGRTEASFKEPLGQKLTRVVGKERSGKGVGQKVGGAVSRVWGGLQRAGSRLDSKSQKMGGGVPVYLRGTSQGQSQSVSRPLGGSIGGSIFGEEKRTEEKKKDITIRIRQ